MLQVEQHVVRVGLFCFGLFAFQNTIRPGAVEHYSQDLQKHHKPYMMTVQSCWTKPFHRSPIEFCPSRDPQVIREPCMWLVTHSKASWVRLFGSALYFINAHELLPGTLLNANEHISLLPGPSLCLLIKLILVEDAGNLGPIGQREEGGATSVVAPSQTFSIFLCRFTTTACLDQCGPVASFVLASQIWSDLCYAFLLFPHSWKNEPSF